MAYSNQVQLIDPNIGMGGLVDPMGSQQVQESTRLCGALFGTTNDVQFWTMTASGAGSAAGVAGGIATLSSGTANLGSGTAQTVQAGRFIFAHPNRYRALIRLTATGGTNNTRNWGAFDGTNGFYFNYNGTTSVLSIATASAGTPTLVASGSFNGSVATYTVDTNVHAYEILYFMAAAWFFIDGVLIHKVTPTTAVMSQQMNLPIYAQTINNISGTTSTTIEMWSGLILRMGRPQTRPIGVHITTNTTTVCKIGAGCLHNVVINKPSSNTNTMTIYDNTAGSGTVIGIITNVPGTVGTLQFDRDFFTGLTIVTATGTMGDITVTLE